MMGAIVRGGRHPTHILMMIMTLGIIMMNNTHLAHVCTQARHQYDQKQASAPVMEEYTKKVLHVDWNRRRNVVSAASAHSVYIYQQEKVNAESKVGGSRSMDMKAMDS